MRTLCSLALFAAFSCRLLAQEQVSRSYALSPEGSVRITNLTDSGSIRVIGWDKDSVVVAGTIARGSRFFAGGGYQGVKMFVDVDKAGFTKVAGTSDLVVRVPARNASVGSACAAIHAGATPNSTPVMSETTSANPRTSHDGLAWIGTLGSPENASASSMRVPR